MGVSLYYSYEREAALSDEKRTTIGFIIESYNVPYPFKETAEPFSFYSSDATKMELEGATKLPLTENIEETIMALYHWLNCLKHVPMSGEKYVYGCLTAKIKQKKTS